MLGGPQTPLLPTPSKAKKQPRGEDGKLQARRSAAMCFPLRHYYFQPGEAVTAGGATAPCPPQCFGGGACKTQRGLLWVPLCWWVPPARPLLSPPHLATCWGSPSNTGPLPTGHGGGASAATKGTRNHPGGYILGCEGVTRSYLHMRGSRQYSHEGRALSRMIMGGRTLRGLFWACNPRRRPPPTPKKKHTGGGWGERSRLSPSNSGTRRPPQIPPARGCAGAVR